VAVDEMTTIIIVRLLPSTPTDSASFTKALNNLTIIAYDRTVSNTSPDPVVGANDNQLGTATGVVATGDPLVVTPGSNPPTFEQSIIQHLYYDPKNDPSNTPTLKSVATALIVVSDVPSTYAEYPATSDTGVNYFDVRFQIERNGIAISDLTIEYNLFAIPLTNPILTDPLLWTAIDPLTDQYLFPTSAYVYLPPAPVADLDPNAAYLNPSQPGQPPNFGGLVTAINDVLKQDSPATAPSLAHLTEPLTIAQCGEIASEIIYNRVISPPPEPAGDLELLYTTPNNQGSPPNSNQGQTWDSVRQTWEGKFQAYHSNNDAAASKLAGFVYAAQAAVWAELQTYSSTASVTTPSPAAQMARVTVPLSSTLTSPPPAGTTPPSPPPTPASVSVVLTSSDPTVTPLTGTLTPPFIVPAAYFYALGASSPPQLTASQRYKAAVTASAEYLDQSLQAAIEGGYLDTSGKWLNPISSGAAAMNLPTIEEPQVVRRLTALSANFTAGTDPQVSLSSVSGIIGRWLGDPTPIANFDTEFWGPEMAKPPVSDYFMLLLYVITGSDSNFINYLLALPLKQPSDLTLLTDNDWATIFQQNPAWLPAFTSPGSTAQRTAAFVMFLRKLLTVGFAQPTASPSTGSASTPGVDTTNDVLSQFFNGASFTLGQTIVPATLQSTIANLFLNDTRAQQWVFRAVTALNNVFLMTNQLGVAQGLQFSYMEALYARGFTSPDAVMALGGPEFQAALAGTVAYNQAAGIQTAAQSLPYSTDPVVPWPGQGFQPVNGGDLVNCIPPPWLSPLGPVEYLFEMLAVTSGTTTLGSVIAARRGPIGTLLVDQANLESRVPLIDLVLESLEALGSTNVAIGAVYNTDGDEKSLVAVPQYSSPSLTISQSSIYQVLNTCFTSPYLPYSQALDVSRTSLEKLGTSRYETMRCFRRQTTEFPQNGTNPPAQFQDYRWRYPVAFPIALEFLNMSIDEYNTFFNGSFPAVNISQLFGLQSSGPTDLTWLDTACTLLGFLEATGLTYCEFLELWKSGFLTFSMLGDQPDFPECPPCCLKTIIIVFPSATDLSGYPALLLQLMYFIRLWRKANHRCHISFACLADICSVIGLYSSPGVVSLDFINQLASFLMLLVEFRIPLGFDPKVTTVGETRTKILGLWTETLGPWAVHHLLKAVEADAESRYKCGRREAEFIKILERNLDKLGALAGFQSISWNSTPTCTIRFFEVLVKIYASEFTVGEILFLFTVQPHLDGDDPFPMPTKENSVDTPLDLPDDDPCGLWELRHKLLEVEVCLEAERPWTWQRIKAAIREMGFKTPTTTTGVDFLTQFAEHFFPSLVGTSPESRRWVAALPLKFTSVHLWSAEPCWPFHYDQTLTEANSDFPGQLWVQLPLKDRDVSHKLRDSRQLNASEIAAVQNLYFAPRVMLAPLAMIFSNFGSAAAYLIQEPDEAKRFDFFASQFDIFHQRCGIIAEHLAHHVNQATGYKPHNGEREVAWRILKSLIADENFANQPWENDNGTVPTSFQWDRHFSGSAFAALLGLVGTGLYGKYSDPKSSTQEWAEMRGPLDGFGRPEDEWDTPVPTVVPALAAGSAIPASELVVFKNGFLLSDALGEAVSGVQPFEVEWTGELLVKRPGQYEFFACEPRKHDGLRVFKGDDCQRWMVKLSRGQKTWSLLNNSWVGEKEKVPRSASLPVPLAKGAYKIVVKYRQYPPKSEKDDQDIRRDEHSEWHHYHPRHHYGTDPGDEATEETNHGQEETGFQLRYKGCDTDDCETLVPFTHLIRNWKTTGLLWRSQEDDKAVAGGPVIAIDSAMKFLELQYVSTLRDIRRTYQRAFKAVLFAQRFCLSARLLECDRQSELGFMLDHPDRLEGVAYYLPSGAATYTTHYAYFDFNLLPVKDIYGPNPNPIPDQRYDPSPQRQAAMFDWWERIFDYIHLRKAVKDACTREAWLLFEEIATQQPTTLELALRHLGVKLGVAQPLLTYSDTTPYAVAADDLLDERWAIRIWHANRWIEAAQKHFYSKGYGSIAPAQWAADAPDNADLVKFVQQSLTQSKNVPLEWDTLKIFNNGLRERARKALLAYLCQLNRIPLAYISTTSYATKPEDLSDLLLQDVEAGLLERCSRIDDAIHSVQTFVQRARLGLEKGTWPLTAEVANLWERRFCSFETWRAWKRRQIYGENWLIWDEMQKLEERESFKLLLIKLSQQISTAVKEGHPFWWPNGGGFPEFACCIDPVQAREPLTLMAQTNSDFEGLSLLGEPWRNGRPTLLAPVTLNSTPPSGTSPGGTSNNPPSRGTSSNTLSSSGSGFSQNPSGVTVKDATATTRASKVDATELDPKSKTSTPENPQEQDISITAGLDPIPLWLSSAIRLGVRFIRVAAAGKVPALPYTFNFEDKDGPCCKECGTHDDLVDEYYFWLENARIYDYQDAGASTQPQSAFPSLNSSTGTSGGTSSGPGSGSTPGSPPQLSSTAQDIQNANIGASSATDPQTAWEDPTQLPTLLQWPSKPAVHLFWTRVHRRELEPPRRSSEALPIDPVQPAPVLSFSGRNLDSLYFTVSASEFLIPPPKPPSGSTGSSTGWTVAPGGFRYDIKPDIAVTDVGTLPTFSQNSNIPTGLSAFPNFVYFQPGKPLFPSSKFGTAMTVADALRLDCQFDCALQWYRSIYDPSGRNNTWEQCPKSDRNTVRTKLQSNSTKTVATPQTTPETEDKAIVLQDYKDGPCCTCAPVTGGVGKARAVLLKFLNTLLQWADSLMCRDSMEYFQQAFVIFNQMERILGPTPPNTKSHTSIPSMTVANFAASPAPLNPELMTLYDEVSDRRHLIHQSLNARRQKNGVHNHEPASWGSHDRWASKQDCCGELCCWSCCQPYRFATLMSKAKDWASILKTLGGALLGAYEKGDAEYLAAMRAAQDRQLADLGLDTAQNTWRAADWDVQALEQSMQNALTRLRYFQGLIAGGLNSGENGSIIASGTSMESRAASQIVEGVAQGLVEEPDTYIGGAGAYGTPVNVELITGGTKQAASSSSGARILNTIADAANTLASLSSMQGGFDRRSADWQNQVDVITVEIQQIKRQQLGAWRRRHVALRELNNHQRQMDHYAEAQDFLRSKLSKQDLYLFLQQETATVYRRAFEVAMNVARETQNAFWYERADTHEQFLNHISWDNLREGLMVGEELEVSLHAMEHAYMQLNCREYEITKQISLLKSYPRALLELKTTGHCEVDIPEWLFDLDYPGHYLRRIRSVSVSIPCIAGPYTGVHCRIQLLSSKTRYKPLLAGPESCCCDDKKKCHCSCDDPYLITHYSATEAIAMSDGVDDDGLFELNFNDERYLPFEFSGAVSRWRIELPPENNEFDVDTLTDLIIKLNYTAREGGLELRRKASECAQKHLPGNGIRYFDIRHEFQDAWRVFTCEPHADEHRHRDFDLRLSRNMFPFVTGNRVISITQIHLFIEKEQDCYDDDEHDTGDFICVCFLPRRKHKDCASEEHAKKEIICRSSLDSPLVYHGILDVSWGPLRGHMPELVGKLRLPNGLEGVRNAYMLCHYEALCCGKERKFDLQKGALKE
jgi:hypothetical protein